MKIVDLICAWGLIGLGVLRCILSITHGQWSSSLIAWTIFVGVSLIATGMLNVLRARGGKVPMARLFAVICNLLLLLAMIGYAMNVSHLISSRPYALVTLIVVSLETFFSFARSK